MGIVPHWFLPTNGDSRSDLSLGNAVGVAGSRVTGNSRERAPDIGYIGQIARSAEQLGFAGGADTDQLVVRGRVVMTAALTQVTERFKFLVAFRPGLLSPTLAAQMAATYQRVSRGRLLLNVVTGGDDASSAGSGSPEQAGQVPARGRVPARVPRLWRGEPVDFAGEHIDIRGAPIIPATRAAHLPGRLLARGARCRASRTPTCT